MNVFECGIEIRLLDRVSAGLGNIALSLTRSQTAADALNARLSVIGKTMSSGMLLGTAGLALATPLVLATKSAMHLQTALGVVQTATGATNAEMAKLNDTLTTTANATGIFSKVKLAGFAADMFSTGITKISQINEMLPLMARGADLMNYMSRGKISAEESAHTFAALSHQFGKYSSKEMAPIIQASVALAPSLPGGLATLRKLGSSVNVLGSRQLGIDPVSLMTLEAALAQTSGNAGSGRGGLSASNLIAGLRRVVPGVFGAGLLSGKSAFSAEVMGLSKGGVSTVFDKGKMSLDMLMSKLSTFSQMSGAEIANKMLANVGLLGKAGGQERTFLQHFLATPGAPKAQLLSTLFSNQAGGAAGILQLLSDGNFGTVLQGLKDRVKNAKSLYELQAEFMGRLEPQLKRLGTNWETLSSTIGTQMIPITTDVTKKLADFLDKMNTFAVMHPKITQTAVSLIAAASGLLMVGGALNIIKAAAMGLQFVLLPLAASFWPVVVGLGALLIVIKNWDKIMGFVHQHSNQFIHAAAFVVAWWQKLGLGLKTLGDQFGDFMEAVAAYASVIGIKMGMAEGVANARSAFDSATLVTAKQAMTDRKILEKAGLGDMVDWMKGTADAAKTVGKSGTVHNTTVNHTVNQNFHGSVYTPEQFKAMARQGALEAAGKLADQTVGRLADGLRTAGAAAARAGGVAKSHYAFGSGN